MARSDTNPKQVCQHNYQGIHQTLLTQTHVPTVHTIRQWHGVQEPDLRQSHEGSWHREDILCTIPPSKQWETRETFHKFLKPTLKKMCAEDQDNWDDYIKQVLGTYRGVPNLTTGESPFFLVYGRDGNQPLHQLLQPLTRFLGDPDSGLLCLNQH